MYKYLLVEMACVGSARMASGERGWGSPGELGGGAHWGSSGGLKEQFPVQCRGVSILQEK